MARRNPFERRGSRPRLARGGAAMRMHCALCGRPMDKAAVMIGAMPVGPTCARKAGLIELSKRKSGLVFPVVGRKSTPKDDQATRDLFEEVSA